MLGARRNKELKAQIADFLQLIRRGLATYEEAIIHVLENGLDGRYGVLMEKVHQAESNADDVRHNIAISLYANSLLPESRGDLLTLIEQIDQIANSADAVVHQIETQRLTIPDFIARDVRELTTITMQAVQILMAAFEATISKSGDAGDFARAIDNNESLCDRLEQKIVRAIFASELACCDRIMLNQLIRDMGRITDLCENIAQYITIFHIKHKI